MAEIDIGMGKSGRRTYDLDDVVLLPGRRTRDADLVDLSWQIDAYRLDLPFLASAMDSVTSHRPRPSPSASSGGLAVLDLEGIWTRHADADEQSWPNWPPWTRRRCASTGLRELYRAPLDPELIVKRIAEIHEGGVHGRRGRLAQATWPSLSDTACCKAELDLLLIRGTRSSRPSTWPTGDDPLNLKQFVRELETPVIVGGCVSAIRPPSTSCVPAPPVCWSGVDGGSTATAGQM